MVNLLLRDSNMCRFDLLSLGEVMLRLDPGDCLVRAARHFNVYEGGGEYNVARGLRRCFGLRTAIVTALADNDIGYLIEDLILQGGVDTTFVKWLPFDGIGRSVRNGINFTERGFGVRSALGVSDRANTAVSQMKPGDVDWDFIFGTLGVRWFHTGGIFAALSENTSLVALEAISAARRHGTVVSYDLNYRPSLWNAIGGQAKAREVNKVIASYVDVMIGNEEDFMACLGLEVAGVDVEMKHLDSDSYRKMIETAAQTYPNIQIIATTLRTVHSASDNDWVAIAWSNGQFYQSIEFPHLLIYDRVGGGDSFASGLIYGLIAKGDISKAVNYGAAHGALAMTTPGDTSMARLKEVEALMQGGSARVRR